MAFLIARSTFWSVVRKCFAIVGYNSLVTLLTTSMSFPDKMIASRK